MRSSKLVTLTAVALLLAMAPAARAIPIGDGGPMIVPLEDENSKVAFDLFSGGGMQNWTVDGVVHLERQWFWWREGPEGGERPLSEDDFEVEDAAAFDTDGDADLDTLFARYVGADFEVEMRFSLMGGEPGTPWSDVVEQVRVENTSDRVLDLHFFQYADFDLADTPYDDEIWILGPAEEDDEDDEVRNLVEQGDGALDLLESLTVMTPAAHRWQAGDATALLALLNDDDATTLDNTDYAMGVPGQLDPAWALQWRVPPLEPGVAVILSKDKLILPEPATLALVGLGGAASLLARRRRRR